MNIRINGINRSGLETIINELGPLFICRCKPYIEDKNLLFDLTLDNCFIRLSADDSTVAFDIENISAAIKQCDFRQIVICNNMR